MCLLSAAVRGSRRWESRASSSFGAGLARPLGVMMGNAANAKGGNASQPLLGRFARRWKRLKPKPAVSVARRRRRTGKQPGPESALMQTSSIADRLHGTQPVTAAPEVPFDPPNLLTDICVDKNTILYLTAVTDLDCKLLTTLRFCQQCICADRAWACGMWACVLAPSAMLARYYFDAARRFMPTLRTRLILGTFAVDDWARMEWREATEPNELLVITPQLFLDTLRAGHLLPTEFCALVFVECKHCVGNRPHSHPMSKIPSYFDPETTRSLGIQSTRPLSDQDIEVLKMKLQARFLEVVDGVA